MTQCSTLTNLRSNGFVVGIESGTWRFTVVGFLLLLFCTNAWAQDFKRQYRNAKDLFDEKKYNLAMEAFKPLIIYDRNNPYPEYASFYYAVAAYEQGYSAVAKDMFIQIRKLYPQWENLKEVNYWLAKLFFDQQEYFQGLLILREVSQPEMQADVASLKQHYFSKIDDPETIRMALEDYPNDAVLARALAVLYARAANVDENRRLFDSLVNQFQFDRQTFQINQGPITYKKDQYVVALLLPFLASTLEPTPVAKVNQQILDLYQGIRMAVDTLTSRGIKIDLRLYDTGSNDENIPSILEKVELQDADLLVGPIFSHVEELKNFSRQYQIPMINPVSRNSDYLEGNQFSLLFQPTLETLGKRAADWVAAQIHNKNVIVYFGDTPRDSVQAFSFMYRAKELGLNIVLAEEHRRETAGSIITTLTTPTEFDEFKNATQYTLKRDSVGCIYVASDNPLIYSKVNSSVTTRGDSIVVIGSEAWVSGDNTSVSFENYERMRITLAAPRFYSEHTSTFNQFRKAYMSTHGVYPGTMSPLGYEFMLFAGQLLNTYGTYFLPGLNGQAFQPGSILQGFDYAGAQDNQYVPFVQFQNGQLVVVNSRK